MMLLFRKISASIKVNKISYSKYFSKLTGSHHNFFSHSFTHLLIQQKFLDHIQTPSKIFVIQKSVIY